jgi:hypothetical protein
MPCIAPKDSAGPVRMQAAMRLLSHQAQSMHALLIKSHSALQVHAGGHARAPA